MFFLAQVPQSSWPEIGGWMVGLIGALAVVALMINVAKGAMELFGRKPPFNELIQQREQLLRVELQSIDIRVTQLRADVEERFQSLNIERTRNLEALHEKINGVRDSVQFIRGRMEGHS